MLNTLLFIHLIIAILLVISILLQKTSSDGLSGIGGGNSNGMGVVSSGTANNFLTKLIATLTFFFFVNAIVLANLSSNSSPSIEKQIEKAQDQKAITDSLPIAK